MLIPDVFGGENQAAADKQIINEETQPSSKPGLAVVPIGAFDYLIQNIVNLIWSVFEKQISPSGLSAFIFLFSAKPRC